MEWIKPVNFKVTECLALRMYKVAQIVDHKQKSMLLIQYVSQLRVRFCHSCSCWVASSYSELWYYSIWVREAELDFKILSAGIVFSCVLASNNFIWLNKYTFLKCVLRTSKWNSPIGSLQVDFEFSSSFGGERKNGMFDYSLHEKHSWSSPTLPSPQIKESLRQR